MAKSGVTSKKNKKSDDHSSPLQGTLTAVLLLGFFIIITWVSVYFLFLERF